LRAGVDIVLLDNMNNDDIARSVEKIRRDFPQVLIEVSGGITLARIRSLAELGVDIISSGALTHSVPAADVALDLRL
jgi:nicotinate-nucleotide pyrophosphorylase (carboxylating)